METMIERVARAIALAALEPETRAAVDPGKWFVADSYYDLARAAIEAMREPTEAMLDVGEDKLPRYREFDASDRKYASEWYSSMIDAALKEQEKA